LPGDFSARPPNAAGRAMMFRAISGPLGARFRARSLRTPAPAGRCSAGKSACLRGNSGVSWHRHQQAGTGSSGRWGMGKRGCTRSQACLSPGEFGRTPRPPVCGGVGHLHYRAGSPGLEGRQGYAGARDAKQRRRL